ncbi:MAG: sugar ABC transporter substrate-binding protein [Halanaerobiales bacterium]
MKKLLGLTLLVMLLVYVAGIGLAQEVTEVTVWHYFADSEGMEWLEEEFNDNHSDLEVDCRYIHFSELENQITKASMTGDVADVVIIDGVNVAKWAENGALAPITAEAEAWGQEDNFFTGAWETGLYNGELYALPQNINTLAIFYNKDLFKEADIDDTPATWAELEETASKISALGEKTYGFTFSAAKDESSTFQFAPFIWQAGAEFDALDSEEANSALGLWQDMIENGYTPKSVLNTPQYELAINFGAGNVGMMVNGPWALSAFAEEAEFEYGVFTMPVREDIDNPASVLGGESISIMSESDNKEAAWEFIKFFQSPEVIGEWCELESRIPARSDVVSESATWSEDRIMQVFSEQLKYALGRPKHPEYPKISSEVQNAVQKALTGDDVEEALNKAAENIDELIQ